MLFPSADVIGTRVTLSNGVTINEPHPARPMRKDRFPGSMDVAAKGNRKVDDIPMFTEKDSYAIDGCLPQCMLPARHTAEGLSLSSGDSAAQPGVGSSSHLASVVNGGSPIASVAARGSSVLYAIASTADEAELRVPASASLPSGVHPCQPILGPRSAGCSGADAVLPANPQSSTTTSQCIYRFFSLYASHDVAHHGQGKHAGRGVQQLMCRMPVGHVTESEFVGIARHCFGLKRGSNMEAFGFPTIIGVVWMPKGPPTD
ncbi:hypothetical protein CTI12_AA538840 [Artemisia annua]|uniref:Uncharacterized protein n=1 Tax=Artemisia annua TaxID=35608 RepID=A0A2U1L283_ARTAN|nr:hypothetical protein CTI12_AA538840 [Artemisia annua]